MSITVDPETQGWKYFFFKRNANNEVKFTFRYQLLMRHIPFINFFWDLFFDARPPGQAEVKDLLNMVGLLNALLLATAASIFVSVNYADLILADKLWGGTSGDSALDGYAKYWNTWYVLPPSNQLFFDISMALCMFFIGVIVVVWVFADMMGKTGESRDIEYFQDFYDYQKELNSRPNQKKLEDHEVERLLLRTSGRVTFDAWRRERHGKHDNKAIRGEMNKTEKFYDDTQMPQNGDTAAADIIAYDMGEDRKRRITSETVFQIYWGYAKYSIFVSMATTIFGCIYAVLACNVMFAIKYPDYYIQVNGVMSSDASCPTGYSNYFFKGVFGVVTIITIIATGMGTAAKYHVEEALRIQAVEVLNHKSDAKNGMNKPAPASPSSTGTRQIGVIAGNDNI